MAGGRRPLAQREIGRGASLRSIGLPFAFGLLGACATEPVREIAALELVSPTTIFPRVLDLPLIEGQELTGCGESSPATACLIVAPKAPGNQSAAYDAADMAVKVYGGYLKRQGWTALAYPFEQTFMSPKSGRCVSLWAGGMSSTAGSGIGVTLDLDPTAIACWEGSAGAPPTVVMPGILDLPVLQGDRLRDYSEQGVAEARVRLGNSKSRDTHPYVAALVSRGWEQVLADSGRAVLQKIVDGRERCLDVEDWAVIVRGGSSWSYVLFKLRAEGDACAGFRT